MTRTWGDVAHLRTIPRRIAGLGEARYTPEEDRLARELVAAADTRSVAVMHALKVELDAVLVDGPDVPPPAWEQLRQWADAPAATTAGAYEAGQ